MLHLQNERKSGPVAAPADAAFASAFCSSHSPVAHPRGVPPFAANFLHQPYAPLSLIPHASTTLRCPSSLPLLCLVVPWSRPRRPSPPPAPARPRRRCRSAREEEATPLWKEEAALPRTAAGRTRSYRRGKDEVVPPREGGGRTPWDLGMPGLEATRSTPQQSLRSPRIRRQRVDV
jgi:hypothetical protein